MFQPFADTELAFTDYPFLDPAFPMTSYRAVTEIDGTKLFGEIWMAGGPGGKGTVVLCPPSDQSEIVQSWVYPLNACGINLMSYFPRGTSREPGLTYSLGKSVDDVHALVAWMRKSVEEGKTAKDSPAHRLDLDRIAVLGFGDGGNIALAACAENPMIKGAIAMAPANPDVQFTPAAIEARADYRGLKANTLGEIDVATWLSSMKPAEKKRFSVAQQAPKLADKRLLLVGASQDAAHTLQVAHQPNLAALRGAGARRLTETVLDTDRWFLDTPYETTQLILSWLLEECGFRGARDRELAELRGA